MDEIRKPTENVLEYRRREEVCVYFQKYISGKIKPPLIENKRLAVEFQRESRISRILRNLLSVHRDA